MKIADLTSSLTTKQVLEFKRLFNDPIPLEQAQDIISAYFTDQDLFAIIDNELQTKGNYDGRDLIMGWLKQNMPEMFSKPREVAPPYESPITSHPDITGE